MGKSEEREVEDNSLFGAAIASYFSAERSRATETVPQFDVAL